MIFTFREETFISAPTKKIIICEGGQDLGFFLLVPHSLSLYEIHTVIYPNAYGVAVEIGKEAINWFLGSHPEVNTLISFIPIHNKLAHRLAIKCNFKLCGIIPNSFMLENNIYIDQEIFTYNKEKI